MKFTKIQGTGNDFIIIDNRQCKIPREKLGDFARHICSRRLSLGADGLMVVEEPQSGGDLRMVFFNNDGTEAEMCGNGARCISRYGFENGLARGDQVLIETASGLVRGKRVSDRVYTVRLNSPTHIELHRTLEACGRSLDVSYIELGTPGMPHCIVPLSYAPEPTQKLRELGRELRWHPDFPKGANVTFVCVQAPDYVKAITFERGVEDFTLACGTGSGSAGVALMLRGLTTGRNTCISVPGGDLHVTVTDEPGGYGVYLTGPTTVIARGELLDEDMEI